MNRQNIFELHDIAGDVDLATLNIAVEHRHLLHQQGGGDDHRQDCNQRTDTQGGKGGQISPPLELEQYLALHGGKQNAQRYCPKNRAVKRQQNPDKGNRDQGQQQQQGFALKTCFVHVPSMSVSRECLEWTQCSCLRPWPPKTPCLQH